MFEQAVRCFNNYHVQGKYLYNSGIDYLSVAKLNKYRRTERPIPLTISSSSITFLVTFLQSDAYTPRSPVSSRGQWQRDPQMEAL